MRSIRLVACSLATVTALALAGCGTDDAAEDTSSSGDMSEMDMGEMDMSAMNEPDATPADEIDGDVTSGEFMVLDTAPPGSDGAGGEAWLGQNDDGTTVTIRLTGLEPETEYLAHLHDQRCEQDNGGEHFRFDPEGAEVPPNEIHLALTTTAEGTGEATVTNDRRVGEDAPAVVIHPMDAMDNRLACANFS